MKDFILAALPWVCMGLSVALCAAHFFGRGKTEDRAQNYMIEGMLVGMVLSLSFGAEYLAYGMLLGVLVGMYIKKEAREENT